MKLEEPGAEADPAREDVIDEDGGPPGLRRADLDGDAAKAKRQEIRNWKLHRRSDKTLGDLAREVNPIVQGWINYYGRFYKSMLAPLLRRIDEYLVRWAKRKYKRLRGYTRQAKRWLARVARREPQLFAHWQLGVRPEGWTMGAV